MGLVTTYRGLRFRTYKITNMTTNFYKNNHHIRSPSYQLQRKTRIFMEDHPELIVITIADKGNITVFMDKTDYMSKSSEMLEDPEMYYKIPRDLTPSAEGKTNKIVKELYDAGHIAEEIKKLCRCKLPKVHKEGCPPVGVPLHNLAGLFLHQRVA